MNVSKIRSEVHALPPVPTDFSEFGLRMTERCDPDCNASFRTQYLIEYNADACVMIHRGEVVTPPVVEDDNMYFTLTGRGRHYLLVSDLMRAIREGHPVLEAWVEKMHDMHPEGFDMSALRKVVR